MHYIRWLRVHVVVVNVTKRWNEEELRVVRFLNHNRTDTVDDLLKLCVGVRKISAVGEQIDMCAGAAHSIIHPQIANV